MALADVTYDQWIKYSLPLMSIYAVISAMVVGICAAVGYMG